jgi:uncharacterized protein YyaL (SSP411 family)
MVTCFLGVVGTATRLMKPYVPREVHGRMSSSTEEFLLQADTELINWYPNTEEPFAVAARTNRPILLVIGTPWSGLGRKLDEDAFQDDMIVDLLNNDFVCVRVDGMHHPDWLNALMPVQRLYSRFMSGCQLWVISPSGNAEELIGKTSGGETFDHTTVYNMLSDAKARYWKPETADKGPKIVIQHQDLALIKDTSTFAPPDFTGFGQALDSSISRPYGGFPMAGTQSPYPCAWTFQLYSGDTDNLNRSLLPILQSPLHDAIDGGFYRVSTSLDCRQVEFDKLTTRNAEMLLLLAQVGKLQDSREYAAAAKKTWSYLTQDAFQGGAFATCRVGDELADGRSEHSSFSPVRMRSILNATDRAWARTHLGLTVSNDPLMTPYPVGLDVLTQDQDSYNRVVSQFEAAYRPREKFAGLGQLSTNGYTAARLLETARIWRDPAYLGFALNILDSLTRFEDGSTFVDPDLYATTQPLLPDYLSYADAELEEYLATGRVVPFEKGLARLLHGMESFSTEDSGSYRLGGLVDSLEAVQDVEVPEIADNTNASCTAQIIRLCFEYGNLLGESPQGRRLQNRAFQAIHRFSGVASKLFQVGSDGQIVDRGKSFSPSAAGYFAAALMAQDDRFAIAVGRHAQELSDELFSRVPTRMVAPAYGPVRPDLQKRAPGIYIVSGASVTGPLTVDQAVANLPATYSLNPVPVDTKR